MSNEKNTSKNQQAHAPLAGVSGSVRISMPLKHAKMLRDLCDGTLGCSENDELNKTLELVIKRIDKKIYKHYR